MNNDLTPQAPEQWELVQREPVAWIETAFGEDLWAKQQEIAESVRDRKYTVVRSCHGIGKSFIAARIVLWFLYAYPDSKVITTAPTWRQVEDILWRELRAAKSKSRIQLGGRLNQTSLDVGQQWFATGLSTDDPTRFQGYHAPHILLVVDEAAGVPKPIFDASEGVVSTGHARILYIGNPTAVEGTFYESFKNPTYSKIHISAFDTPNFTEFGITLQDIRDGTWEAKVTHDLPRPYFITPEWVASRFFSWGEGNPMWDSRIMGEFPQQGEDTLIPLARIDEAALRHLVPLPTDPEQIGVDVARFGSDKTEFTYRKGPKVLDWRTYNHADTMLTAERVRDYIPLYPTAITVIDVIGVGAGVYDRLLQWEQQREIHAANVGTTAFDTERYLNLRAEIFWALRERFLSGDIDLSDLRPDILEELSAQLSSIKFKHTARGQIQIESKDDMKKRGLPSPDKADALALAFGRMKNVVSFNYIEPGAAPKSQWDISNPDQQKQAELEADLAIMRKGRGW